MACSPSSSTDKSNGELADGTSHLISGKRQLLVNDYVAAVASLQEACQLFSKHYGETALECGEPYLYYGKALLELSRMESGVLGNALQGVNDEEEESEDEEEDEQVEKPDKVTGEEREQIVRLVEAAIDENSRDLEEKFVRETKCDSTTGHSSSNAEKTKVEEDSLKTNCTNSVEESKSSRLLKADSQDKSVEPMEVAAVSEEPDTSEKVHAKESSSKQSEDKAKNAQSEQKSSIVDASNCAAGKVVSDVRNEECKTDVSSEHQVKEHKSEANNIPDSSSACKPTEISKETSSANIEGKALSSTDEEHKVDSEKKMDVADDDLEKDSEENDEESATGEESESTGDKSQDEGLAQDSEEAGPSTSSGAPKEDKEEDVSNLQLAWEMLELCKIIFKRQSEGDESMELKVAEVLLKLGEVSIESENYQQAIEDLTECFNIQKKHLAAHDRALAETLYQLGLATSFDNQFERAIENFTSSMKVLEERIIILKQSLSDQNKESVGTKSTDGTTLDNVQNDVSNKSASEKSTAKENISSEETNNGNKSPSEEAPEDQCLLLKQEIEELEELIPDIRTKIEDTEDMMKNAVQSLKEAIGLTENCESPCKSEEKAKPISNISHLVKRKVSEFSVRKPEDDGSSADTNDQKKPRPSEEIEDNHVNGETVVNGDSKTMETEDSEVLIKPKVCPVEKKPEAEQSVA